MLDPLKRSWRYLVDRDLVLLIGALVVAAGGWAFYGLAEYVNDGATHALDEQLLFLFRDAGDPNDPIGSVAIEEAVRDVTALGGMLITTLLTLIVVVFFLLDGRPRWAGVVAGSVALGTVVIFALKLGFDRPRPELVPHAMHALSPSFPSGHAATSAVVYLTLGALLARSMARRRLKIYVIAFAAFLTLSIGVSRVYLGVHWPSDVLAGWTVGAAWALLCWLAVRQMERHGWLEWRRPEPPEPHAPAEQLEAPGGPVEKPEGVERTENELA